MDNTNLKSILKWGEMEKVIALSGLSRFSVYEYIKNPGEWKGAADSPKKILAAIEQVIENRKQVEAESQGRLAHLLNQSENIA